MGAIRALLLMVPLVVATVLSHGCGVSFSDNFEGTELFKGISLSGTAAAGPAADACIRDGSEWVCSNASQLTVHLTVTDGYPVPVRIACFMEDPHLVTEDQEKLLFHERAQLVGEKVLEARDGARPSAKKLEKQALEFSFDPPPPGGYFLACNTPAAADNGLSLNFRVRA